MALDLANRHASGIERHDLVIEVGKAATILGDQLWLEAGLPVARHLQIELASAGQDGLAAVTVPMIAWFADHLVCAFRSQVLVHLGIEDALRQRLLQL